jgi:hypothetical protein
VRRHAGLHGLPKDAAERATRAREAGSRERDPNIGLATSPKKLIAWALELGPPANVLKACDARHK